MDLNFVRLIATLSLEGDVADRCALFGIKPSFEEALRRTAGCRGDSAACTCLYHQTFSQSLSADPIALKRYQKPSLPFVFSVPLLPAHPMRTETVEVEVVLAGPAVNSVNTYIAALEDMLSTTGVRGTVPVSLVKVEAVGCDGCRSLVMTPGRGVALDRLSTFSLQGIQESAVLAPDAVSIAVVTPMLVLSGGKPLREFSFSSFMRALFRRVSSLAYYYGTEEELDYKWLAARSREVECFAADFRWVEWGRKVYGVVGTGSFRGAMTDFHPFLLAGEFLHVGKGAPFGLGRYVVARDV